MAESQKNECTEEGCDGQVDYGTSLAYPANPHHHVVYACKKCGRVHWETGRGTFTATRPKLPFFYIDGKFGTKEEDGHIDFFYP